MPCNSDYLEPNVQERESARIIEFLKETRGQAYDHEHIHGYGNVNMLTAQTQELCAFCATRDISKYSLELQLWWRKHQKHDAERVAGLLSEQQRKQLVSEALAKLTPQEREALLSGRW